MTPAGPDPETVADCVHCGFCLPACPTYALWGEEMDSPRGRIHLMEQELGGEPLGDAMVEHFDRCLGCMACVTACPSGVRYDQLITDTRAQVEASHRRPFAERALRAGVFAVFPYRRRLALLRAPLRLYQRAGVERFLRRRGVLDRLPEPLRTLTSVLPPVAPVRRLATRVAASGPRRGTVAVLTGCVQGAFFSDVNAATVRVLAAEGFDVVVPRHQGCCGALSEHSGRGDEARGFARRSVDTFAGLDVDALIVNSAGCGSTIKEYGRLLGDDPSSAQRAADLASRSYDVAEWLAAHEPVAPRHPFPLRVAYHDACHLAHAQGVRAAPRLLLHAVPDLQLLEVGDDLCCGSAGVYNLLQPEAATQLGDRKAEAVAATGADLLVAANPGCSMQITAALRRRAAAAAPGDARPVMPVAHTVEVLDASIRGLSPTLLTD